MATSSLIINETDQKGTKLQRTVTFTNEDADREKLLTFAQGLNGLLTNNFVEAKRVQKVDLDTEPDGGWHSGSDVGYDVIPYPEAVTDPDEDKESPTITLSPTTITTSALKTALTNADYYDVSIAYNGDGTLYVDYLIFANDEVTPLGVKIVDGNKLRFYADSFTNNNLSAYSVTVRSTTTDTCNPATATFSITE